MMMGKISLVELHSQLDGIQVVELELGIQPEVEEESQIIVVVGHFEDSQTAGLGQK